ncbi:hypothetical protein LJ707_14640 [Mucilaginibacter sp. UR6-1]|uniref:hypothetical protein n=1 Tax=Mucilaginibacter sp. UR6-1 TaxID=1435643 RepID=UPI001E54029D|nr:hypothetical protein [Mucilaginibacter sp. UR6-1]MCC8410175.1 hypothetical protein [Mucilaginibacter sp. UR6-1]
MRIPSLLSLVGFIVVIAATYCPMLRPFGLFSMNVYDMNKPFGMVILLVAVIGMIGVVFNQLKIARLAAWTTVTLSALLYVGAYLKVHTSFSFLPMSSVAAYLTSKIKFKWGWYVLFTGAVLCLSILFSRKSVVPKTGNEVVS